MGVNPVQILLVILIIPMVCGIATAVPSDAEDQGPYADLVFLNGTIYTVQPDTSWDTNPHQAIATRGKTIIYVGNDTGAGTYIGPATNVTDLYGKTVLPGLFDTHVHYAAAALAFSGANLTFDKTVSEYQQSIRQYAEEHPDFAVIRGYGWNYEPFGTEGPNKTIIDEIVPDKPVVLMAFDGHCAWVNSAALNLAKIDRNTPNPEGGKIERDANGDPTGTLREASAIALVAEKIPPVSYDELMKALKKNLFSATRFGVTTAHEAAIIPQTLEAYSDLEDTGNLTVRIIGEILVPPEVMQISPSDLVNTIHTMATDGNLTGDEKWYFEIFLHSMENQTTRDLITEAEDELIKDHSSGLFRPVNAKLFLDGVVEGHTAVLLSPYTDRPGESGTPVWNRSDFEEMVVALDKAGFQIDVHAIGDGAVRMAIDAYEKAEQENGIRDSRHKVSHIQLISPGDIPRMKQIGLIAALQPNWFYYDEKSSGISQTTLGKERADRMYSLQSLMKQGVVVAFGSDWPVGTNDITMNPLDGIQTAVIRLPFTPSSEKQVYRPEERITVKEAVEAATIKGAYASFMENETGSLEEGKHADLIVLDRDIIKGPSDEINKATVLTTILEGRVVYSSSMT